MILSLFKSAPKLPELTTSMMMRDLEAMCDKLASLSIDDISQHFYRKYDKSHGMAFDMRRRLRFIAASRRLKFRDFDGSISSEQRGKQAEISKNHGELKANVICPHCQTKGGVYVKSDTEITRNRVNSIAGQAIGLGTNSSKKVKVMYCCNCDMDWNI